MTKVTSTLGAGGVLAVPIIDATAKRHWDTFRKLVSFLKLPEGLRASVKEHVTVKNISAYFEYLKTAKTVKKTVMAPSTMKSTYHSFCVLAEAMVSNADPDATKKEKRKQKRQGKSLIEHTKKYGKNIEAHLAGEGLWAFHIRLAMLWGMISLPKGNNRHVRNFKLTQLSLITGF